MKEESVSVKQGKKALFYLIVQYQTDKIEAERTIQMGNGNRGNTMIIKNGLVFTPEGKFEKKDFYIEGEYVAKETTDNKEVEAEGCYVIPGLVDIHFHGCVRHDMCDGTEESIQALADYEAANGVLAICPATMTIPEEELFQAMNAAREHKNGKGADLVGINMEGPFVNKEKKGAQKEEDIKLADVELFHKLQEAAGGLIKLVDLAPETEGAMDFINQVKDEVHVSIAHTMADYDTATEAINRGVDHIQNIHDLLCNPFHNAIKYAQVIPPFLQRKISLRIFYERRLLISIFSFISASSSYMLLPLCFHQWPHPLSKSLLYGRIEPLAYFSDIPPRSAFPSDSLHTQSTGFRFHLPASAL